MEPRPIRGIEVAAVVFLIVSLTLEACGGAPAREAAGSRRDARAMVLAIHSLVLDEEDAENAGLGPGGSGALMRPAYLPRLGPIDEVKAALRDLEAECARARVEIENLLPEADKSEELAALEEACQTELGILRATLQELRARRDRSWWRRAWLGRRLASAWQTVKKNRRAIALALVTGGTSLAKKVLIDAGRAALKAEARMQIGRFLAKRGITPEFLERVNLSPGRWPPRRAGSGDQTASDEEEGAAAAQAVVEDFSPTAPFELPADGLWTAECRPRPCAGCTGEWTWTLSINLGFRLFESHAEYNDSKLDQGGWLHATHLVHAGVGEITEDGMLHGPYHETTTLTWTKGGVEGGPQTIEFENNLYGAFSADLKSICISRGEDPGNYDIDYIRRIGREAFFGSDKGCEAECTITQGP